MSVFESDRGAPPPPHTQTKPPRLRPPTHTASTPPTPACTHSRAHTHRAVTAGWLWPSRPNREFRAHAHAQARRAAQRCTVGVPQQGRCGEAPRRHQPAPERAILRNIYITLSRGEDVPALLRRAPQPFRLVPCGMGPMEGRRRAYSRLQCQFAARTLPSPFPPRRPVRNLPAQYQPTPRSLPTYLRTYLPNKIFILIKKIKI